jgi:hypothetical protein
MLTQLLKVLIEIRFMYMYVLSVYARTYVILKNKRKTGVQGLDALVVSTSTKIKLQVLAPD